MRKVRLFYRNRADECTLSGGSYSAGAPLNSLLDRDVGNVARTTDTLAASTQFTAALSQLRPIGVVAIIRTNCGRAATYRVRIYTDAGLTALVYDSGTVDVWPAWMYPRGSVEWEDPRFWDGRPATEDLPYFSSDVIHPLASNVLGRYIKVEFSDSGNAAGYLEFGRLFVDDGWEPVWNISRGNAVGHEDLSTIAQTPVGKEFFTERDVRRYARFQLAWMTDAERWGRAFDMQRIAKTVNEVLYIRDPSETHNLKRNAFMGRVRELSPIEDPFVNSNSTSYEIKEIL